MLRWSCGRTCFAADVCFVVACCLFHNVSTFALQPQQAQHLLHWCGAVGIEIENLIFCCPPYLKCFPSLHEQTEVHCWQKQQGWSCQLFVASPQSNAKCRCVTLNSIFQSSQHFFSASLDLQQFISPEAVQQIHSMNRLMRRCFSSFFGLDCSTRYVEAVVKCLARRGT